MNDESETIKDNTITDEQVQHQAQDQYEIIYAQELIKAKKLRNDVDTFSIKNEPRMVIASYIGAKQVLVHQNYGIAEYRTDILLLPQTEPEINKQIFVEFYGQDQSVVFQS